MTPGLHLGAAEGGERLVLDPKALTTHGFILGMTGSGKTGLCVVVVEELLRAGIPVIAVDSKGDLGTLLLGVDPGDTAALTQWTTDPTASAAQLDKAQTAAGLTREQHAAFRRSYEGRLYTPGATLGLPLDLLGSLTPPADPSPDVRAEAADGAVRGLLGLVGIEADPVSSREYLLLVQIITAAWEKGQTPSLIDLVRQVSTPPFQLVGALPLEDFYPQKDRQALMVRLNGLLASPKFAAWRTGEPLDPAILLRAPDGRPRLSVFSVAHLSDEERIFAVAQLLERTVTWMRKQGGGQGLRAVILLDEIYGYFPPSPANPPTKPPLISLLKQARAFGVSVVLATQNPIDLDYRGLANIGTWMVGRLQTEQDKARIRDALASAAAATGTSAATLDGVISRLQPRQFLLHSVHRPAPAVLTTRDAMTLLHGPFSADELRALAAPMKAASSTASPALGASATGPGAGRGGAAAAVGTGGPAGGAGLGAAPPPAAKATAQPPIGIDPELGPLFEVDTGHALPFLMLKFGVRYRVGTVSSEETMHELGFPLEGSMGPAEALEGQVYGVKGLALQAEVPPGVTLATLPAWVTSVKKKKLESAVKERLPSKLQTKLFYDEQTKLVSGPTETVEAFSARVAQKAGLAKDAQKLGRELEKKRADLAQAEKELSVRKAEKWANVGAGVMSLFSSRRSTISGLGKALSGHRAEGGAEGKVEDLKLAVEQLEQQVQAVAAIDHRRFVEQVVVPVPKDVQLVRVALAYIVP